MRAIEGGGVVVLPRVASTLDESRAQVPLARVVRRARQEREPRRRHAQGRAGRRRRPARARRHGDALRGKRGVARDDAVPALRALMSSARARAFGRSPRWAATCPGARTTRACTSMRSRRGRITASASCACSPTSIRREPRVWRVGEPFESMAKTLLPRIRPPLPGSVGAAGGAARHQGQAQRATTT